MPTSTTISYGDEITENSVATLLSLGGHGGTKFQSLALAVVSRDGSRRILNVGKTVLANLVKYPAYLTKPLHSNPLGGIQRWEGCLLVALAMPRETGQQVILWNYGDHSNVTPSGKQMVGLYVPYAGTPTAALSKEPVNHIPADAHAALRAVVYRSRVGHLLALAFCVRQPRSAAGGIASR